MKKYIILIMIFVVAVVLGIAVDKIIDMQYTTSELTFKKEYESINNQEWRNGDYEGKYLAMDIPKHNLIKYATDDNIVSLLKEGTHVIYFGNAKCNWCRSAVSVLIDASLEYSLEEIYYYDILTLRKIYEDGSDMSKINLYEEIINQMNGLITTTFDSGNNVGKTKILAPTVVIVSEGKVIDVHVKTVDSHIVYGSALTENQELELKKIYQSMFKKMVFACNGSC